MFSAVRHFWKFYLKLHYKAKSLYFIEVIEFSNLNIDHC